MKKLFIILIVILLFNGCKKEVDVLAKFEHRVIRKPNYAGWLLVDSVEFTNLSTGKIKKYYWDFGNGDYSYEKTPNYEYPSWGTYTVELTVYAKESGIIDTYKEIVIYE